MALRVSCCSLVCILALSATSREARAVVLLHDQFLEKGGLEGKIPMPGPPSPTLKVWNAGAGGGINPVQVVNGEAVLIQTDAGRTAKIRPMTLANRGPQRRHLLDSISGCPARTTPHWPPIRRWLAQACFSSLRAQSPASSLRARTGVLPPSAGGDFRLAINADNSNLSLGAIWSGDLEFDTTYRAVISYNAINAMSQLWLDPVNESSTSVTHTGTVDGHQHRPHHSATGHRLHGKADHRQPHRRDDIRRGAGLDMTLKTATSITTAWWMRRITSCGGRKRPPQGRFACGERTSLNPSAAVPCRRGRARARDRFVIHGGRCAAGGMRRTSNSSSSPAGVR